MSYTKREWATGNVVGAVDLNRIENGIEDAGSGQVLVVTDTEGTLDKTWQEIYDAFPNCYIVGDSWKGMILNVYVAPTFYGLYCYYSSSNDRYYSTSSTNGYPDKNEK